MAFVIPDPAVPPAVEPVSLTDVKAFLRVNFSDDDANIATLVTAAREYVESFTRRSLVSKGYIQALDSFPYFTDTMMSQMAYPPSYYSLPKYSTTLWNYSQLVKLFYAPLVGVSNLKYLSSTDSAFHSLVGTTDMSNSTADFLADIISEPPRLFPKAGQTWPPVLYVPNAVQIYYTSGYGLGAPAAPSLSQAAGGALAIRTYYVKIVYVTGSGEGQTSAESSLAMAANELVTVASPAAVARATGYNVYAAGASGAETLQNTSGPIAIGTNWTEPATGLISTGPAFPGASDTDAIPSALKTAIMMLAGNWYENREATSALTMKKIPAHIDDLLWSQRIIDFAPTRG